MDNYEIRELPTDKFGELWLEHGKRFFEDESQIFRLRNALSENELENIEEIRTSAAV